MLSSCRQHRVNASALQDLVSAWSESDIEKIGARKIIADALEAANKPNAPGSTDEGKGSVVGDLISRRLAGSDIQDPDLVDLDPDEYLPEEYPQANVTLDVTLGGHHNQSLVVDKELTDKVEQLTALAAIVK